MSGHSCSRSSTVVTSRHRVARSRNPARPLRNRRTHQRRGHGEVYQAKDTRLERTVAVKVLPEHLAENAERKHLFERPSAGEAFVVDRDGERFIIVEPTSSDPIPTELVLVQIWFTELERLVSPGN